MKIKFKVARIEERKILTMRKMADGSEGLAEVLTPLVKLTPVDHAAGDILLPLPGGKLTQHQPKDVFVTKDGKKMWAGMDCEPDQAPFIKAEGEVGGQPIVFELTTKEKSPIVYEISVVKV